MMARSESNYYVLSLNTTAVSIVVNILLVVIKLAIGIISGSIAVMADAFHGFSDIATTGVVMVSLSMSRRPADSRHPFGHGRIEDIAGLLMCVILIIVGLEFVKNSIIRITRPPSLHITDLMIVFIFLSAVVKIALGAFVRVRAKVAGSSLLATDAAHHYSDSLSSFIIAGGLILVKKGLYAWDAYLGIFVAGIIIFWSLNMMRGFVDSLVGKRASSQIYRKIKDVALSFPEVKGVHGVEVHSYGRRQIVSLHIVVDKNLSLEEAHSVADSVEKKLVREGMSGCVTHVDIIKRELSGVRHTFVEEAILEFVESHPRLRDFHKLRIITTESESILNFHLLVDKDVSLEESHLISHQLSEMLKDKFQFSQVNIHLEPYVIGDKEVG